MPFNDTILRPGTNSASKENETALLRDRLVRPVIHLAELFHHRQQVSDHTRRALPSTRYRAPTRYRAASAGARTPVQYLQELMK